jgi:hypothetical protein
MSPAIGDGRLGHHPETAKRRDLPNFVTRTSAELDLKDQRRATLSLKKKDRIMFFWRRPSRRDPGQQYLPGRVPV